MHRLLAAILLSVFSFAAMSQQTPHTAEDLEILSKALSLQFRQEDFGMQHEVPFMNASETIFQGLRGLLDDQVAAERRPAAIVRLRKYSGTEADRFFVTCRCR